MLPVRDTFERDLADSNAVRIAEVKWDALKVIFFWGFVCSALAAVFVAEILSS